MDRSSVFFSCADAYQDPYELNSFSVVARELHFHRSAEYLALSQPALSKQIRRLEEKIGGKLFIRTRRTVTLTEVGRVLWPLAEALLKQSEAALVMAREASNGTASTLHIGYGLATVHEILPKTVSLFSRKYPRIRLQMSDLSTASQLTALLNGALDVGIVRLPVLSAELDSLPLMRKRLVLVLPKTNRYRARKLLSDLRDAPFVLLARSASPPFLTMHLTCVFGQGSHRTLSKRRKTHSRF